MNTELMKAAPPTMKTVGGFRQRLAKALGFATASPQLVEALRLWEGNLQSFGNVYRKLPPVRIVVDFLADSVSCTPLKVYRKVEDGREEVDQHPLARLLNNPNPTLTRKRLIQRTMADLAIYGNAYWRKQTSPQGTRILTPLPPFRVSPRGGDLGDVQIFELWTNGSGEPIRIPKEDVVHFKLYDPEDPRVGSSKLEALRAVLVEEVESSRYRSGFWRNSARPDVVLKHPGQLSDEAHERMKADWNNTYGGAENAGKAAILEEGTDISVMGISAKESEFIAGRVFILEATARVYGIPLPVLSLTNTATYASQVQFRKALYQDTLPPWYELIQSEIELQLLPDFRETKDIYVEFTAEAKLRGDFADQAEIVLAATGRPYMLVGEARKLFNLEPIDDPTLDKLVVPVNNVALSETLLNPPEPPGEPSAPEQPVLRAASQDPLGLDPLGLFFDRQEQTTKSRLGAGWKQAFNKDRWNRELAPLLGLNGDGEQVADRINTQIEIALLEGNDADVVFEQARIAAYRAAEGAEHDGA